MRIVLVRHGRPAVPRGRWIDHRAFAAYIDDYQRSGIDLAMPPPAALREAVRGAGRVFTSDLARSIESARLLLPQAQMTSDAVFTEAPLASPPLPRVKLKAPAWAVVARIAWHGGFKPGIEGFADARKRARHAADILTEAASRDGLAVLVAHGYFNAILGRRLRLSGWRREGTHKVAYWNTVVYHAPGAETEAAPKRKVTRRIGAAIGRRLRRKRPKAA